MPNWCEGSCGIRGKKEDILRFLQEEIERYRYSTATRENEKLDLGVEFEHYEAVTYAWFKDAPGSWFYIKGTQRAFVTDDMVNSIGGIRVIRVKDDVWSCRIPVQQAWDYRTDDWLKIARDHHLDINLYGIEHGMEFISSILIIDEKVVKDERVKPVDWAFECPFPWMGG